MEQAPPPPYQPEASIHDLPPVPRDHVADANSPRHLPALEPTLSHESQPGPDNPMNTRRYSSSSHLGHHERYSSGITLQPLRFPQVPEHGPGTLSLDAAAVVALASPTDRSASAEEHDDRVAAEALLGLGKPSNPPPHQRSASQAKVARVEPAGFDTDLKYYNIVENVRSGTQRDEPEPLLSLLTSSHPWLGGTINSSVSAYSSTKQYTPRFLQRGANIVENTVGAVGRRTGVEGGIRRYLDSRRPSEHEDRAGAAHKTAEYTSPTADLTRSDSARETADSLPAYDANRSPSYEEAVQHHSNGNGNTSTTVSTRSRPSISRSWSTQLMISTSGLGAALNETSLQSLKYCLTILTRANGHVRHLMEALRNLLARYAESSRRHSSHLDRTVDDHDIDAMDVDPPESQGGVGSAAGKLAAEIRKLNHEIWQTFHNVVNYVSRYTGGALPENASTIVRWQLMSVPGRWHRAVRSSAQQEQQQQQQQQQQQHQSSSMRSDSPQSAEMQRQSPEQPGGGSDDAVSSANRMLAFAMEGLDMIDQVSGVVDSTIVSAEKWLDSMGRRKREQQQQGASSVGLPLPVQAQHPPL